MGGGEGSGGGGGAAVGGDEDTGGGSGIYTSTGGSERDGGVGFRKVNGNWSSTNSTCRDVQSLLVTGSRQRYALCVREYPTKTQGDERASSL